MKIFVKGLAIFAIIITILILYVLEFSDSVLLGVMPNEQLSQPPITSSSDPKSDYPISENRVPGRSYTYGDPFYRKNVLFNAIGIVLISSNKKTPTDRNLKFCNTFMSELEPVSELNEFVYQKNIIPTYWLLKKRQKHTNTEDFSNCKFLIDNYHYARSLSILSMVDKLSVKGPVLIAESNFKGAKETLIFDLSNFSEDEFERAMRIWRDRVTMDPKVWTEGFTYVIAKEEIRNLFQTYGSSVMSLIK